MPETDFPASVLVAIPTLGRRDLSCTLRELARQVRSCPCRVDIVVLDNSGNGAVDAASLTAAHGCRVIEVADPGLATVRNAAIDLLETRHAALIFLDDDERPEPAWLQAMVTAHRQHCATVVLGPVGTRVSPDAPAWLLGGAMWRATVARPDGAYRGEGYSGNTLIDAQFLRRCGLRFDARYDQTGGEDTDFFRRLRSVGAYVVWAQQAGVVEAIDRDRATVRGVVRRSFHAANLSWHLDRLDIPAKRRPWMFVRRTGRFAWGASRVTTGVAARRNDRVVRGLCDMAAAAGTLTSLLGYQSEYYR